MSEKDYNTAKGLPVSKAADPQYRALVRAFAERQNLTVWHHLLRTIGEAAV